MSRAKPPLITAPLLAAIAASALLVARHDSQALQGPRMALDMATAGTAYDEATNTMVLGPIENCLTTAPSGNNSRHLHFVHIVLQDAVDIIGWQARLNYDGGKMRPSTVNFSPFSDGARGQNVSFLNLPIDPASGVHRDVVSAATIPAAAAGAQTALVGAVYNGFQDAAISPDTPAKSPPDDASYNAPGGGVVGTLALQVPAGQAGEPVFTMDLDDSDPNPPGSGIVIFNGTGSEQILLSENALSDGFHAEGPSCVPPAGVPPVPADDPGVPDTSTPNGDGGTAVPGATSPTGTGPDGAAGSPGGSPGGTRTTGPTADGETPDGGGSDDNDGTPVWLYVLIVIVVAAATGGGFAAWRYRTRLPWFRT